ncbi:MAG: serine/threonine protein kinase, partial [Planctomycetes bacterium]|nr:serine/threonine protein kinase [Planctomycetota bacterium]
MQDRPEPGGGARREVLPRISGYLIEGVLGRGGSSVVYRARQRSVDRLVALKVLHPEATRRQSTVKRLRREARLMAMLDHPNIVSAFDVGESPDGWWMAMELIEGQPLSERLRRGGPMGEAEAIALFLPLADALQHAHEAGVIHRDVKPANVILTAAGEPRLVDLGLARSEDEPQLTRLGATMGTPHYVSPEQARNPADVDSRSDVYSLAATMHDALCGAPPFPGESPAEVLASVLHDPLSDPREAHAGVSRGMSLVLRKALSKDPARRHASARELGMDLKLLMKGKRPRVHVAKLEPLEGQGRSKAPLWVAAIALVVTAGAFALRDPGGVTTAEPALVVKTELQLLEEGWQSGALGLREAITQHASVAVGAREVATHERLRAELESKLEGVISTLRVEADALRRTLLLEGRFEEARAATGAGFDLAVSRETGYATAELPEGRGASILRWRERAQAEVDGALATSYREAGAELRRWAERSLWPTVREQTRSRDFVAAQSALASDLSSYLERAGVRAAGLEVDRLRETVGWRAAEEPRQRLSYELDRSWRER